MLSAETFNVNDPGGNRFEVSCISVPRTIEEDAFRHASFFKFASPKEPVDICHLLPPEKFFKKSHDTGSTPREVSSPSTRVKGAWIDRWMGRRHGHGGESGLQVFS